MLYTVELNDLTIYSIEHLPKPKHIKPKVAPPSLDYPTWIGYLAGLLRYSAWLLVLGWVVIYNSSKRGK